MTLTARLLTPLAVTFLLTACGHLSPPGSRAQASDPLPAGALLPSQNLLVGRVLAVDAARGFAFVDLATSPPTAALAEGAVLVARTDDLHETARLRVSRHLRGRTLGTRIVSGQPTPGNEVVWPAP